MRARATKFTWLMSLVALLAIPLWAQSAPPPDEQLGLVPYQSYHGGDIDSVNLSNGNANIHIPFVSYPQRGGLLKESFSLVANGKHAKVKKICPPQMECNLMWTGGPGGPGVLDDQSLGAGATQVTILQGGVNHYYYFASIGSPDGASHAMGQTAGTNGSGTPGWVNGTYESLDGTDMHLVVDASSHQVITDSSGILYYANLDGPTFGGNPVWKEDPFGNVITITSSGVTIDTIGRNIPSPPAAAVNGVDTTHCPQGGTLLTPNGAAVWSPPGYGSGSFQIKFCYVTVAINIPPGPADYGWTANLPALQSIVFLSDPNYIAWNFEYNDTDGGNYLGNPDNYGSLTKITLPTGGTISYTYETMTAPSLNDLGSRWVASRTVDANDGMGGHTWNYTYSPASSTTVTDPTGNDTVHTFTFAGGCEYSPYETSTQHYQGSQSSGQVLKTVSTQYTATCAPGFGNAAESVFPTTVTTTWPNGQASKVQKGYDSGFTYYGFNGIGYPGLYGKVIAKKDYDYGASSPTRTTNTTYLFQQVPTYLTYNIMDPVYSVQVNDANSNQIAYTSSTFDASGQIQGSGISEQHTSAPFGSYHGLETAEARWVSGSSYLTTNKYYNDTGTPSEVVDPANNATTYTYSTGSPYYGAYLTKVTNALGHITQYTYDAPGVGLGTGLMTSMTDPNLQVTNYKYDTMWRKTEIDYPPGGGETKLTYNDASSPINVQISDLMDSSGRWLNKQLNLDGLGRLIQRQITSDPNGTSFVDTTYDALGRVASVSNPYYTTSDPTYGVTSYNYDALGRNATVGSSHAITFPDGTTKDIQFTNRAMLETDASGIQKAYQSDGLGRLQYVCDGIGAGTQANGHPAGDPSSCGLDVSASGFLATYGYSAIGDLTSVNFSGQTRSFTFDGLSRMLTENVPEIPYASCGGGSHSKCYTYDSGTKGDLYSVTFLKPDGTAAVNGIYSWDALHRLSTLQYSDGSNGYGYSYDASTWRTWNLTNTKGRLTSQSHSNGAAAAYSYDAMGRPVFEASCAGTNCYGTVRGMLHSYDYLGNVAILTDAYGTSFTNTRNAIGQVTSVASSWSDATHPGTLLSGVTYNAMGEVVSATNADGLPQNKYYDHLGRLTEFQVGSTSSPTYLLYLTYYGNGSVHTYNDTVEHSNTYTYDAFNRLSNATNSSTGQQYSYSYDQYGNRWQQHLVAGTGTEVDYTFDANNHNTSFTYDYMGNVTKDTLCTGNPCWSFDYAGQLTAGGGASYLYDAHGRRQQKTDSGGTVHSFVFDGDKPFDEYAPNLARVTGGFFDYEASKTEFNYTDHLGTPHLSTDQTGAVVRTESMGPWGDNFTETNTTLDFTGFAGGFWDSENNAEHFGAREYQNTHGSWLSPDPAGMAAVDLRNPQTLNRYAYVGNNPVSLTDPDGRDPNSTAEAPGSPNCGSGTTEGCAKSEATDKTVDPAQDNKDSSTPAPPPPPTPGLPKGVPYLNAPGHHYKTKRAAAKAQIRGINPTSVQQHKEYAGRVVQNADGTYGVTGPNPGNQASSSPGPVPEGTINAARWHTHGGNDPGYDNEHFSPQDKANAAGEHVDSYLGTPGGTIREYDPSTGSDVIIGSTPH